MFQSNIQTVDLLVSPGVEEHELEPLARAQIKDDWGDVTYKLQAIQHVQSGAFPLKDHGGAPVGELNAKLYFVYFKLLH